MLSVWRITTTAYARSAFSGEGARRYGGRWNPKGIRLVYTAANRSLALLEMLVQDQPLRARYVVIEARIPKGVVVEHLAIGELPPDWRTSSARMRLQAIGAEWARKRSSAVLAVPSAVVPGDWNYLINPRHAQFRRITLGKPMTLETDLRLIRGRS